MQQIQPDSPGAMPVSLSMTVAPASSRHEGIILIGSNGHTLLNGPFLGRVVQRLLSPPAQIEGVDCRLNDPVLIESARMARAFIMLLPPLGNLGNPLYGVHPRRNDRFLAARPALKALFPEVDFTEFDFTGHMLATLSETCPARFAEVRSVLRKTWRKRLSALLVQLPEHGVLLHLPGPAWLPVPKTVITSPRREVASVDCADRDHAIASVRAALGAALTPMSV